MFVCGWLHGPLVSLPAHRIEIIANTSWKQVGRGFAFDASFEALVKALSPGGDAEKREDWKSVHYVDFSGWPAERVQESLRFGREPVFERFSQDAEFHAEITSKAPELAARYERMIQDGETPQSTAISKVLTRRL